MSIYATLDGIIGPQLASNKGWGDICRWVRGLGQDGGDELRRLTAEGWSEQLGDKRFAEVVAGVKKEAKHAKQAK